MFKIIEYILALFIFLVVNPLVTIYLFLRRLFTGKNIFRKESILLGKDICRVRYFNSDYPILAVQSLYVHVLTGRLSVCGTSLRVKEVNKVASHNGKSGLYSIALLRRISRIDYESYDDMDIEYLANKSFKKDLMILVKAILKLPVIDPDYDKPDKIKLLDIEFLNMRMDEALSRIAEVIDSGRKEIFAFMNPDCFNRLFDDREYFELMKKSNNIFPDGSGVNLACKIIRKQLIHNVNGTDMLPYLCHLAEKKKYRIFLLGAAPGIAEKMKKNLVLKYKGLIISDSEDGYFDRKTETGRVITKINDSHSHILLVAFGVPLQEKWIAEHIDELKINVGIGVGGLFDFYSGNIRRAPKWMREMGIEWMFRLLMEPRRMWKRYIIGNPLFIKRVKNWMKGYNSEN